MRRLQITLVIAVALTALAAGYWAGVRTRPESNQSGFVDFTLTDLDGKERRLSAWGGRPLVLNFWATWCAPCREEIPLLIDVQKRYTDRGLQVIGVAIDRRDAVAAYSAQFGINYPVLIADEHTFDVLSQYGNRTGALPYTVIFSANGDIVSRKLGAFREVDLEKAIALAIKPQLR